MIDNQIIKNHIANLANLECMVSVLAMKAHDAHHKSVQEALIKELEALAKKINWHARCAAIHLQQKEESV